MALFWGKSLSEYAARAAVDHVHEELGQRFGLDRAQRLIAITQRVERAMIADGKTLKPRHRKKLSRLIG